MFFDYINIFMPYCSALNNHLCVDKYYFKPCCRYSAPIEKFNVYDASSYLNSNFVKNIKENMKQGWDQGCNRCQIEESIGKPSLRQYYNDITAEQSKNIEFLELIFSNFCNLSCKMCSPVFSSKWEELIKKNLDLEKFYTFNRSITHIDPKKFLENLNLESLKHFKYLGGEPFIIPETSFILDYLDKKTDLTKITFHTNTNCTFFPKKLISKILKFKEARISLSVDGINDLCNYIRTGKKWKLIDSIINQYVDLAKTHRNIRLTLHTTLQAYNLHQIDILKEYADKKRIYFSYSILQNPEYLSLKSLPTEYINSLSIKNTQITNLLDSLKFDETNFLKLKDFTITTDKILKTSIKDVIPNLFRFF